MRAPARQGSSRASLPLEHALPCPHARALDFREPHPMLRLRLQQFREDPPESMARLHLAAGHRFDGPADAHARVREEHILRPPSIEDRLLAYLERVLPERQGLRDLFGQDHPFPEEQAVARVGHDALVELPDGVELLLRNLHEPSHEVARTWVRTIKVVRILSAPALRADEQVAVPHETRRVDAARFAVPLDPLCELRLEPRARVLARDFNQLRPDSEDVIFRDDADELSLLDDGESADLALRHLLRRLRDLLVRVERDDGGRHDVLHDD